MASQKVKFTSESITTTEKKINENFSGIDLDIATKQDVMQFSTMPTASTTYVGKIVQFVGTTDSTYTNGYFYECNLVGGNYVWEQKEVQPASTVTLNGTPTRDASFYAPTTGGTAGQFLTAGGTNTAPTWVTKSFIESSEKGAANGVAELDSNGLVPSTQLPSYVDDVIEAYIVGSTPLASDWLSTSAGGSALTPEDGKIYLIVSPGNYQNKQYRWSGTTYALCNPSDVNSVNGKTGIVVLDADDIDDTNTTNKFVTAADKTNWDAKQNAIASYAFTSSDAGWSAVDSNGFYTLTIVSTKVPFVCTNTAGEQIMAGLKGDGTNIYVITDTKFSGTVYAF